MIQKAFPQRDIQKHLDQPDTFPLIEIRIYDTLVHRMVYKL